MCVCVCVCVCVLIYDNECLILTYMHMGAHTHTHTHTHTHAYVVHTPSEHDTKHMKSSTYLLSGSTFPPCSPCTRPGRRLLGCGNRKDIHINGGKAQQETRGKPFKSFSSCIRGRAHLAYSFRKKNAVHANDVPAVREYFPAKQSVHREAPEVRT